MTSGSRGLSHRTHLLGARVLLHADTRLQNLPGLLSSQGTPEHLKLTPTNKKKNTRQLQNVKAGKRDGLKSRPFTGRETDTQSQTEFGPLISRGHSETLEAPDKTGQPQP